MVLVGDMKARLSFRGLIFISIAAFFEVFSLAQVLPGSSGENCLRYREYKGLPIAGELHNPIWFEKDKCDLTFTRYPYQPSGNCFNSDTSSIRIWDTFQTTRCCQNTLIALSQALAARANSTNDSIFSVDDEVNNCRDLSFQQSLSADYCGFSNLFHTTPFIQCSSLTLPSVTSDGSYKDAVHSCSDFGNDEFEAVCRSCSYGVVQLRDNLLEGFGINEHSDNYDDEKAMCGFGAITSIAAQILDNQTLINQFYECLPILDNVEINYIKIKYSIAKLLFCLLIASATLGFLIILIKYVSKKKPRRPIKSEGKCTWSGIYRFSKDEIEKAINFESDRVKSLGRGSAGQVFKGVLPSGQIVAIKKIFKTTAVDHSFISEVENLSRARHPNLVCLLGCCMEDGEQYLVYEYCAEGNLGHHLSRNNPALTWEKRVQILRDCALGLRYLHQYVDGCIVHRDIKLTNILLTEELEAKLSDFGLAKMLKMDQTEVFTDVRGTIGYMDPEYMTNANLTCASDIYSFGIVALQLLSGQKVIQLDIHDRDQLTRKAKDVSLRLRPQSDFEDPRLNGKINSSDFAAILQIAVLCVAKSSKGRPAIDVIFEELDKRITKPENSLTSFSRTSDGSVQV